MALQGVAVHCLSRHFVLVGDELGRVAHRPILKGAPEAVHHQAVPQLAAAVTELVHTSVHQMGRVAHTLHTAHDEKIAVTQTDGLGRQHRHLQAGPTDFVDSRRTHTYGQPAVDGALAGDILALPCGDDVAHQHFVDIRGIGQIGPLHCRCHRSRAQLRGGERAKRTL